MSWYAPLRNVVSRGSQIDPVGGLAGLAAAREQHLGQFFTPESVVRFMWRVVGLADARVENRDGVALTSLEPHQRWQLLDNSFGSARMFAPADPALHVLHGVEVDAPLARQVADAATAAGFTHSLQVGASMVDATLSNYRGSYSSSSTARFHVGLINPPFSLHFDSPHVARYPGLGCFGRFGAGSSCMSQSLAVAQALAWCDRVVAVVPRSFAVSTLADLARSRVPSTRLVAIFHLPRSVFRGEGAEVDVSVLVWSERHVAGPTETTIDAWPITSDHVAFKQGLAPLTSEYYDHRSPSLTSVYTPPNEAVTSLSITGDRTVRLGHDGRHVRVICKDAATYVQAMNLILERRATSGEHRRVVLSEFAGQGRLDIETLLAQPNPDLALGPVVSGLRGLGLTVSIDSSFRRHLERRIRQHAIDVAPFGHTALVEDGGFADWLAEQNEVRVVPRVDSPPYSQNASRFTDPEATAPCPTCDGTGLDPNYEPEPDDDPKEGACWQCRGLKVVDASTRQQRLRIIDPELTIRRSAPASKEPKSTKRWWLSFTGDAGRDVRGQPLERSFGESWLEDDVIAGFTFPDFVPYDAGWTRVHPSLSQAFPAEFAAQRRRALAEGIDRWTWAFQFHDLCEIGLKRGAIIAWEMGLGKARLAAALCLMGGKANLITVETRLIKEMEAEFRAIGLPASSWQTITKPEQLVKLRRINLISYDKLKSTLPGKQRAKVKQLTAESPLDAKRPSERTRDVRHTYAGSLRRRIHTHVCDEGHLLANHTTQQSVAVVHVSAKGRRYLLTGTPISNYPRNVMRLVQWAAGDGTARQIYGDHWPLMRAENLDNFTDAPRGVDHFRDRFVTTQWVTPEFEDEMSEGAKREVPVIADIPGFRKVVAHVLKRRTAAEPDVAKYVKIPVPTIIDTIVPWDLDHYTLYHKTSEEFVRWYQAQVEKENKGEGKGAHLIAVLRKLYAVYCAANFPQGGVDGQEAWTGGDTTKQRLAVERLMEWTRAGRKSIVLAEGPRVVDHLAVRLREQGVDVVVFHGGVTIAKRVDDLDKRFRNGKAQVLAATKGVLQTGYNIAEASRVLLYDGTWTPKTEHQAMARVLRPQQRLDVLIERLLLRGSIDEYQRQMVDQKTAAMRSGLDYGAGSPPGTVFKHLDAIFGQFVSDFEAVKKASEESAGMVEIPEEISE